MEPDEMEVIQLELKYCERCGGLWLRIRGTEDAYCCSCSAAMSEVAVARRSRRPPRLPIRNLHGQRSFSSLLLEKGGMA